MICLAGGTQHKPHVLDRLLRNVDFGKGTAESGPNRAASPSFYLGGADTTHVRSSAIYANILRWFTTALLSKKKKKKKRENKVKHLSDMQWDCGQNQEL